MIRVKATIIILFCISLGSALFLASAEALPFKLPLVQKGGNLFDCTTKLEKQGGGHTDYGGNEVYEFDLKNGRWKRLTNPSPLSFLYQTPRDTMPNRAARYCWGPDMLHAPGSAHTYDGLQFSKKTRTIFLFVDAAANGPCFYDEEGRFDNDPRILSGPDPGNGIFEFNPSRHEERNGVAPLTWRRLTIPQGLDLSFPRTLELPDGAMMVGDPSTFYPFDPLSGTIGKQLWHPEADWGDGIAEFHPTGLILSLHRKSFMFRDLQTGVPERIATPQFHGKSLAVDKSGRVFSWDGKHKILAINLQASERNWSLYDWSGAAPPSGDRRVYSKWQYISTHDVFVGLSSHTTGVWVYKHPTAMQGVKFAKTNLEDLINKAKPGSIVRIPSGLYDQGLFINKSLTVKLKDVQLWGVAEGKGIINVKCDSCSVVIEDFYGDGLKADCLNGICAGIKAEGKNFNLTVRRAHLDNTVMGILTDNRGGQLVVEDSLIENTGLNNQSDTLGHGLYAGNIDSLVIRRSTIRNVNSSGHTLKTRAKETILENVYLLGEQGFHSRSIDVPCGGILRMTKSVIQHGVNSENSDVIALGAEPDHCEINPSEILITKSWILIDRTKGSGGNNVLFRWFMPQTEVELKDNHIVNLGKWHDRNVKKNLNVDFSLHNKICRNRAACGLSKDQLPVP